MKQHRGAIPLRAVKLFYNKPHFNLIGYALSTQRVCFTSPALLPTQAYNHSGNFALSPSTDCLDETNSAQSAISGLKENMVPRVLEPTAAPAPSVQRMGFRSQSPFPFDVNTPTDAARLMDQFQLEPIIHDINASQLMQDFHLETFDLADQLNAAQLMQQFDWFNGIDGLQLN